MKDLLSSFLHRIGRGRFYHFCVSPSSTRDQTRSHTQLEEKYTTVLLFTVMALTTSGSFLVSKEVSESTRSLAWSEIARKGSFHCYFSWVRAVRRCSWPHLFTILWLSYFLISSKYFYHHEKWQQTQNMSFSIFIF